MTERARTPLDDLRVTLRHVEGLEELQACQDLEAETWGSDFDQLVPASILMICQKIGGLVAGAFDQDNRLLGFVYGLDGHMGGERIQWSHMLAVRSGLRGLGLGRRLKLYQREQALEQGIGSVYWTYDPLVARNAHLNLNRLGTEVADYLKNVYGAGTASPLHGSTETDRFLVRWDLRSSRAEWAIDGESVAATSLALRDTPVIRPIAEPGVPADAFELPEEETVRVEIPNDIVAVIAHSLDEARSWRATTRRAFEYYLGHSYHVASFFREAGTGRCYYVLTR